MVNAKIMPPCSMSVAHEISLKFVSLPRTAPPPKPSQSSSRRRRARLSGPVGSHHSPKKKRLKIVRQGGSSLDEGSIFYLKVSRTCTRRHFVGRSWTRLVWPSWRETLEFCFRDASRRLRLPAWRVARKKNIRLVKCAVSGFSVWSSWS